MKARKKKRTLVRTHDDKWYLAERVVKQIRDGQTIEILQGEVTEVTDSVEPFLNGTAQRVRRLESICTEMESMIRELCPYDWKERLDAMIKEVKGE